MLGGLQKVRSNGRPLALMYKIYHRIAGDAKGESNYVLGAGCNFFALACLSLIYFVDSAITSDFLIS